MGFFSKLKNWITGKGFKETVDEPVKREYTEVTESSNVISEVDSARAESTVIPDKEPVLPEPDKIPEKEDDVIVQPVTKPEIPKIRPTSGKQSEIDRASKVYDSKPTVKSVEEKINVQGVNRINEQTPVTDMAHLRPQYESIFSDNAKIQDKEIVGILIENRARLQHRFEARFTVFGQEGEIAEMTVNGLLIEHTGLIYNFVNIGMRFDSPQTSLYLALVEAKEAFKSSYGAIGGSDPTVFTKKKSVTVTDIKFDMTFA